MNDVDYTLRHQVRQVDAQVNALREHVNIVAGQVEHVRAGQQAARSELQQLRDDFKEYVRTAELNARIQRAETRIGVVQDQVDHEFGHYKQVRRTATGILQAFDVGLVTEDTVRSVSEQLMIQTPRYWLAPALVALASWSADDPRLCERGVEEAYRRSPDRTSLFFALVLRRQDRADGSVRWLRHYLQAQDPHALGREFTVILEAVAHGAFGAAGRDVLAGVLTRWNAMMADEVEYRETQDAQTRRWRAEVDSLRSPSAAREFPQLAAFSPQWSILDGVLSWARTQRLFLDKYQSVLGHEAAPAARLEDTVDDLLDLLVSEYDDEELPLRRELALNRAVVTHRGDTAAADAAVKADEASYGITLDLLTLQTTAALSPAAIGVSEGTRKLAVGACREWLFRAHTQFTRDYRAAVPQDVQIRFHTDHTVGAQNFRLPLWTGSFLRPLAELEQSLTAHWGRHSAAYIDSLGFPLLRKSVPAVAVVAAVMLGVSLVSVLAALACGAVVGLGWGLRIRQRSRAAARLQQQARSLLGQATAESLLRLRAAAAELADWYTGFKKADEVETACAELIASLGTTTDNGSPFGGRSVQGEGTPA
ncbi:hypothetical protein GT204_04305 [Streptomyces sp. SID4919]|uniref:hypothetical protein n=1 Tax=unclassified Streptomyces TaxID=2593676 RepID=UPI000823E035|nr:MULTISPECIES: hypothetical protein [unclassified Streptomyces]MYY08144.1 hypothetical protein [Streptomyces sp. SID4919]SCK09383.1 hypothetical protein YW7DRAFT_00456 [Streptomyces sp. AmelKG-E11A]